MIAEAAKTGRLEVGRATLGATFAALVVASAFLGIEIDAGPLKVRPFDFLLGLALFVTVLPALSEGRFPRVPVIGALVAFGMLAAYTAVNAISRGMLTITIVNSIQAAEFFLFYVVLCSALRTPAHRRAFMGAITFFFWVLALGTAALHISVGIYGGYKLFDEPKLVFGLLAALMMARFLGSLKPATLLSSALVVGAVVLMVLSGERKGWIAFAAAVVALLLTGHLKRLGRAAALRTVTLGSLAVVALAGALALSAQNPYVAKQLDSFGFLAEVVTEGTDNADSAATTRSNAQRLMLAGQGIEAFKEEPVFGIGPTTFKSWVQARVGASEEVKVQGVHNEYLRHLAELGLIGLALYVLIWLLALKAVRDRWRWARQGLLPREDLPFLSWATVFTVYSSIIMFFLTDGATSWALLFTTMALLASLRPVRQTTAPRAMRPTPALSLYGHAVLP